VGDKDVAERKRFREAQKIGEKKPRWSSYRHSHGIHLASAPGNVSTYGASTYREHGGSVSFVADGQITDTQWHYFRYHVTANYRLVEEASKIFVNRTWGYRCSRSVRKPVVPPKRARSYDVSKAA